MRRLLPALLIISMSHVAYAGVPPPQPPLWVWLLETPSSGCDLSFAGSGTWSGKLGTSLEWRNGSGSSRVVEERHGLWHWTMANNASKTRVMSSAGTFEQRCDPTGTWRALPVRLTAPGSPPNDSFMVTWATSAAPSTHRYSVEYRIGTQAWQAWKTNTAARYAVFAGRAGRTYTLRASTNGGAGQTKWSPAKRVLT